MEKAFAYVCASEKTSVRQLKRYCRAVFDLGYVPICPRLGDGQYLDFDMSQVYDMYVKKNRINHERAEGDY